MSVAVSFVVLREPLLERFDLRPGADLRFAARFALPFAMVRGILQQEPRIPNRDVWQILPEKKGVTS